jgi:hypothetical protein
VAINIYFYIFLASRGARIPIPRDQKTLSSILILVQGEVYQYENDLANEVVGEFDGGETEGGLVHQNVNQSLFISKLSQIL